MREKILEVVELKKYFPVEKGIFGFTGEWVRAVDGVSFKIWKGETLGLVGESGCGKSTLARVILGLYPPTQGKIYFEGKEIFSLKKKELRKIRRNIQAVFQDPFQSLNPRLKIGETVGEGLLIHHLCPRKKIKERVKEILVRVGLGENILERYPHEFSGGERQRISLARVLALNPRLIICDEPVSSLDVTTQSQILDLFLSLKKELSLSYLFIAHDLNIVQAISERVAVMYLGRLVEVGPTQEVFSHPLHPYTQTLLDSIPLPDPKKKIKPPSLPQEAPSPVSPPPGCRFHPRCGFRKPICSQKEPPLLEKAEGRKVACWVH